jgi:pimeloyl-ACP methyl ester carboxylesterase
MNAWNRAALEGFELEYQRRGSGEPVVFVHAGVFADWFEPLLREPALADRYSMVTYHRIGYAGSSRLSGALSIAGQAAHLRSLIGSLGLARAHIVGHSSGALIALQLALDAPDVVHSLAILEPALPIRSAQPGPSRFASVVECYRSGDKSGAIDMFMRVVAGPSYRPALDQALPHAFTQGIADSATFFEQELPAIQAWSFQEADAKRLRHPVLLVMGERSVDVSPIWQQRQDLLTAWLPNVQPYVLPNATHLLHLQNPRALAERLSTFFLDHAA